jgi:hypothetical protein
LKGFPGEMAIERVCSDSNDRLKDGGQFIVLPAKISRWLAPQRRLYSATAFFAALPIGIEQFRNNCPISHSQNRP